MKRKKTQQQEKYLQETDENGSRENSARYKV